MVVPNTSKILGGFIVAIAQVFTPDFILADFRNAAVIVAYKVDIIVGASSIGAVMGVGEIATIASPALASLLPEVANTPWHFFMNVLAISILERADAKGGEVVAEVTFFVSGEVVVALLGAPIALAALTTLAPFAALAPFSSELLTAARMWNEGKESCCSSFPGGGSANAFLLSIVSELCDELGEG